MTPIRTQRKTKFVQDILSIFSNFRHLGCGFLDYVRYAKSNDVPAIRDKILKPIHQRLGYDEDDFYHEVAIPSGTIDLNIGPAKLQPVIAVKIQSANVKNLKPIRRDLLFPCLRELNASIGIITNGAKFEVWEQREAMILLASLDFAPIVAEYTRGGLDAISDKDFTKILKLMYLKKELRYICDEHLYALPHLDISREIVFENLLDDLAKIMEVVKMDIEEQFDLHLEDHKTFTKKQAQVHGWQLQKLHKEHRSANKTIEYYHRWAEINHIDLLKNCTAKEKFVTETMYILINRILLIRIAEDKGIIKRKISNGGIEGFKKFIGGVKVDYNKLLYVAYDTMKGVYEHFFKHDIFDWYVPDSELLLRLLFVFNKYKFTNVNRDILGKLYEKYIDKEERKRLGQFYTPDEVIQYILDSVGYTSDAEIDKKILLDPACGSGGFLIPAANRLIERLKKKNLSAQSILDIVQNNICGLDINPFAAHLTETNLLFQIIDLIGDAKRTNPDFTMGQFNVIVTDFLLTPREEKSATCTNISSMKSTAMQGFGTTRDSVSLDKRSNLKFDFIVGNPPYLRIQKMGSQELRDAYRNSYKSAVGRFDISVLFIERGIKWLKPSGKLGFVTTNKFMTSNYGKGIRKIILQNCRIEQLVDLADTRLFEAATLPCIIILKKERGAEDQGGFPFVTLKETKKAVSSKVVPNLFGFVRQHLDDEYLNQTIGLIGRDKSVSQFKICSHKSQQPSNELFWHFMPFQEQEVIRKIKERSDCSLSDIAKIIVGIKTNADHVFTNLVTEEFIQAHSFEPELLHPVLRGKNVRRWKIAWTGTVPNKETYVIYPHQKRNGNIVPADLSEYPNVGKYLKKNESVLRKRDYLLKSGRKWYEIWVHQEPDDFVTRPKIITPDFSPTNNFALDTYGFYCLGSCFVIILKNRDENFNKFILGLLNSKVMEFFHKRSSSTFIYANRFRYWTSYMAQYPIVVDFNKGKKFSEMATEIKQRVSEILDIVHGSGERKRSLPTVEDEMNSYVYQLYNINQKEIQIIENFLSRYEPI